jgi:predicted ATPase/DNA-binding NarL/FixJ family response regulator/DNA-binding XRE family transcriptional regulator
MRISAYPLIVSEPRSADSVAARLRVLRGSLGLSQEQLARRLGVSFATVNRWESGRTQLSPRAELAVAELEAELAAGPEVRLAAGLAQLEARSAQPHGQLPFGQTSFVGRERELAELAEVLSGSRLVSLIGPGGAGKTRLAVEVISRTVPQPEVVFVPLESVRLPHSLVPALASRLGVHDQPGISLTDSLRAALADADRLLVLDGAESLRAETATLVRDLLAALPRLRIIVTSRVLLGVPGEVCWTVPPLDCPSLAADAAGIAASDAVQLFIARARDRLPGFQAADVAPHAIAELCRRLDGLPLAIELIASWVGTLSIREILQQRAVLLDTDPGPAGQQEPRRLADVLQASYDLLDPAAQRMLPLLSCFAGRFGLADAQAVLDSPSPATAVALRTLVDSSWLVVSQGTEQNLFGMLETIRSFATAQLEKTEDGPAARSRHARHFADLAARSETGLTGPDAAAWTDRMRVADPDLQVALQWAADNGEEDLGLETAAGLWRWWLISGRLAQGRSWLGRMLAPAASRHDETIARALCAAAVLATENGDYREAIGYADRARQIFSALGLRERTAFAATVLASAHRYLGNNRAARHNFQVAMELRLVLGDRRGVSVAINNMALLELDDGNLDRARELFEQALAIKRELAEPRSIAIGLANLADVLIRTQRWEDADRVLAEAASLGAGIPQIDGTIRCNQGNLASHREDWAAAAEHFEAAIAASQASGHPHDAIEATVGLAKVLHRTGRQDEAIAQLQSARALAASLSSPQRIADVEAALTAVASPVVASPALTSPALTATGLTSTGPTATGPTSAEVASAPEQPAGSAGSGPPGDLTARQAEVLGLLATGLSNKQIAATLFLSPATVERHLATIYRNLGLTSRVEAARFAIENGLAALH